MLCYSTFCLSPRGGRVESRGGLQGATARVAGSVSVSACAMPCQVPYITRCSTLYASHSLPASLRPPPTPLPPCCLILTPARTISSSSFASTRALRLVLPRNALIYGLFCLHLWALQSRQARGCGGRWAASAIYVQPTWSWRCCVLVAPLLRALCLWQTTSLFALFFYLWIFIGWQRRRLRCRRGRRRRRVKTQMIY